MDFKLDEQLIYSNDNDQLVCTEIYWNSYKSTYILSLLQLKKQLLNNSFLLVPFQSSMVQKSDEDDGKVVAEYVMENVFNALPNTTEKTG